jgi:5-methylcytosine-specific restriction protein A
LWGYTRKITDGLIVSYSRDKYISDYAKRRAHGICQLCEKQAPFIDKEGKPFLEAHHIVCLSQEGKDSVDNTVALCPNCHRKMHILDDEEDKEKLLRLVHKVRRKELIYTMDRVVGMVNAALRIKCLTTIEQTQE